VTFWVKVMEVLRTISVASTRVPMILMRIFVLFSMTCLLRSVEDGNGEARTSLEGLLGLGKCRMVGSMMDRT